jgi:hypothetical protein
MELAGLEPATSWVRFGRGSSRRVAMVRQLRQLGRLPRDAFAARYQVSLRLLDQDLTTARRSGP